MYVKNNEIKIREKLQQEKNYLQLSCDQHFVYFIKKLSKWKIDFIKT